MVTREYAVAAAEVNQVLSYLPTEEVEKIPQSLRDFLKKIEYKNVWTDVDRSAVSLYDQNVSPKAKQILAMIYAYYFTTLEEVSELPQEMMDSIQNVSSEIFGDKTEAEFKEEVEKGEVQITEVPKKPWYKKLIEWFKIR